MNWGRAVLAGLAAGFVQNIVNLVVHVVVLGSLYVDQAAFAQEEASPISFGIVALVLGVATAILFACSRNSWKAGAMGGLHFGVLVGAVVGFQQFYLTLVINEFPYQAAWSWLGADIVSFGVGGLVLGALYKKTA